MGFRNTTVYMRVKQINIKKRVFNFLGMTICCGQAKNRSICCENSLYAAGIQKTAAYIIIFFLILFLFIVAYIKNRSKWLATNDIFSTSGSML